MLIVNVVRGLIVALALLLLGYIAPRIGEVVSLSLALGCALTLADLAEQKLVDLFDK